MQHIINFNNNYMNTFNLGELARQLLIQSNVSPQALAQIW